ncbi:DNA polymerase III, partial [Patescibacteria group bacterium]|nr:DNA polymerase III [Patescibacteria group bacterium]
HHNIALREYAQKKGLSLSEYGIRTKNKAQRTKVKKFNDEEGFYKYLGLKWISPELREDAGEIEAAIQDKLPNLVQTSDIKADLQIHSDFNIETSHDLGESSMKDVVNKADKLGYEYIAMTEHNPSQSGHSDRQIMDLLKRKKNKIEEINSSLKISVKKYFKRVFNSLEIDILPNGQLPISDKTLELLDFALVSIHSSFKQNRDKMTKRVLDGLNHPKVKIFAHPTGRKLNKREGVELDWPKIMDFCKNNNKWLEINADPMRLDLPDVLVKDAVDAEVLLTLGTDAHHTDMMDNMRYGVYVARRGWAEKANIVNTRSLNEFEEMLE